MPAAEISAAKGIIDQAIKAVELVDMAERIEYLEQFAAQEKDQKVSARGGAA